MVTRLSGSGPDDELGPVPFPPLLKRQGRANYRDVSSPGTPRLRTGAAKSATGGPHPYPKHVIPDTYKVHIPDERYRRRSDHRLVTAAVEL